MIRKLKVYGLSCMLLVSSAAVLAQNVDEGKKFLYNERYTSAKDVFTKAYSSNAKNADAAYWLGQTQIAMGDTAGAATTYQTALQANANSPLLMVGMGHVELLQNKASDAKNRFETAISLTKGKDADVLNAIGRANVDAKAGDVNYAIEKLNLAAAADKKKKNADIYLNLGDAYRRVPDGAKAQQAYENALMIEPNNGKADFMIGRLYQTQGKSQEAVYMKYYNDAISKDASYAPVYAWLSEYYYKRDINKAKEYLDKYIAVADQDSKNCYYQASYLYASGKFQDAVNKSDECIKAGGENPYASLYGIKAYAYDKLGDSVNAKSFFDTYFQKQSADKIGPSDYAAYAKTLLKFPGNEELAGQYVDKAVTMDTVDANKLEYVNSIANGFIEAKNYNEAAKWYTRLLNVKKDYGKVDLYYAGYNFYRGGNYVSSDSIFKLYQAKYPTDIFGWFMGARSKEGIDTSGEEGLALADYQQVLAIADTAVDKEKVKDNQIKAYKYILAYNYNIKKDVEAAKAANEKILELDPADAQALSNRDAFNKAAAKKTTTTTTTKSTTTTTKKPPVKKP